MKLLFLSNLFPDASEPGRGIFNARLVRRLGEHCEVRVASPRPTLPCCAPPRKQACPEDARFAPIYPPGWYLPKLGSRINPWLMARSLRGPLARLRQAWPFDVVLAAWVFPDACAVARLAAEERFPFAAVAQGSDVHQYLRHPARRAQIVPALNQAGGVVARSGELARLLREAGVAAEKIRVICNGVDTAVFHPGDRLAARRKLGLPETGPVVLFIGNFLPIKNPLLALAAFAELRRTRAAKLVMLGDGSLRADLLASARQQGLVDDLLLPGCRPEAEVALYLNAADLLCVASHNEGLPNVILEALASGLPVAATRVGGIPEVLTGNPGGWLVPPGDAAAMAQAMVEALKNPVPASQLAATVQRFSWLETTRAYLEMLRGLTRSGHPA